MHTEKTREIRYAKRGCTLANLDKLKVTATKYGDFT